MLRLRHALSISALGALAGCGRLPDDLSSERHTDPFGEGTPGSEISPPEVWSGCTPACAGGASGRVYIDGLEYVAQVTGADSNNRTDRVGVWGTDMGSIFLHGGALHFAFGDTFGDPRDVSLRAPGHPDARPKAWQSNAMAYSTDAELSDGLGFDGWIADETGMATPMLPGDYAASLDCDDGLEVSKIPTAGLGLGERQYLWYMSIECWETFGWHTRHAGLAHSDDGGGSWKMAETPYGEAFQRPADSHFTEVAVTEFGSQIYLLGSPAGRAGGLKLGRVDATDVALTDPAAHHYYDPLSGQWVDTEHEAATVIEGPVGESSLTYDPYLGQWLLMHLWFGAIVLRTAPELTGPWSEPVEVFHSEDPSHPAAGDSEVHLQLPYAPMVHPAFLRENGRVAYFLVSFWGTPDVAGSYNVHLMRMTLGTEDCGCP